MSSCASVALPTDNIRTIGEHCVISDSMMKKHRRTNSPDAILFLKVPDTLVGVDPATTDNSSSSTSQDRNDSLSARKQSARFCPFSASEDRDTHSDSQEGNASEVEEPITKRARLVNLSADPVAPAKPVRRAVHFDPQEKDSSVAESCVYYYDKVEPTDISTIWWSGEEMLEIQTREKSAIGVMSFCCDHYADQVLELMKLARDESCGAGMATMVSDSPVWVANSSARGLEKDIVQGFKQRKRKVVRKVLQTQESLKAVRHEITGQLATAEQRSRLLSAHYEKWSKPMLRFAQVLAEGDAQVVLDYAAEQASYNI